MKKIASRITLTFALLLGMITVAPQAHAAPNGLFLFPSEDTYTKGTNFAVQVRINGGSNSGVQANLTFDTAKLFVVGMSNQGSALSSVTTSYNNDTGRITIYSVSGSGSGDRLITTIVFRGEAAGNTAVNFTGTNQTLAYVLLVPVWSNVATNNATYTIVNPDSSTPPPSGGGSTPSNPGSGGGSSGSTGGSRPSQGKPSRPNGGGSGSTSTPSQSNDEQSPDKPTSSDDPAVIPDRPKVPDFQLTPPNNEPWENDQAPVPTRTLIVPWLPIIVTTVLGSLVAGIFIAYRRTHLSNSLRRLIATVVNYRIALSESQAAAQLAAGQRILPRIIPILAGMPKLLAYTAPKLLASGIKRKLLGPGNRPNNKEQ